jgi:hypothetical protein
MNTSATNHHASPDPLQGVDNLLKQCLGVKPGETILLVLEEDDDLYDRDVGIVIEARCSELGIHVTVLSEPLIQHAADFPESVSSVMRKVDHTLFLSRLGDYVRFVELPGQCTKTTSYTYTLDQLGSPYASVSHTLLAHLRDKLEQELLAASTWQITCPLGTNLTGSFCWPSLQGGNDDELLVGLFPVSTFKPIPCENASGRVALSRWLMPGGAPKIKSPGMNLSSTVYCDVHDGKVQRFFGPSEESEKVTQHYDRIASTLGINRNRVHSWHLGINPQTCFPTDPDLNFEQWCALSFGSPRYLHFHTCGDEPPGEIAWSLFNCTVLIDDQPFWKNGQFIWLNRADNRKQITQYAGAEILFDASLCIGV